MSPQAIWEFAVSQGMCDTQNCIEQLSARFSKCCIAVTVFTQGGQQQCGEGD